MPRRNKLIKFSEILSFPNVYENYDPKNPVLTFAPGLIKEMKGKWSEKHFGNHHPLILELACGRGEYTLGLAKIFPNKNFIGMDIKGARIWKGASIALRESLDNAAFLRARIELIEHFFDRGEVNEIWITYPDPFLKKGKENRRLTAPLFLDKFYNILNNNGKLHLKTDSKELFDFSLETIQNHSGFSIESHNTNVYAAQQILPELEIKTYYESMHLAKGLAIKYVSATRIE